MELLPVAFLISIIPGLLLRVETVHAAPLLNSLPEENFLTRDNAEYIIRLIPRRTAYNMIPDDEDDSWTDSKRGIDLGLGRGYSGSMAAKQRMGLAVANFAGGPGRRRRNGIEV